MTRYIPRALVDCPFIAPAVVAGTIGVAAAAAIGAQAPLPGVIAALAIFYISLALMHRTSALFDHTRLTIPSFFYLSYLPMIYIPAFVVFGERTDPARWTFLIAVHLVLIMVPAGIGLASLIARYTRRERDAFYTSPIAIPARTDVEFHLAAAMFAIAALITIVYFAQLDPGRIPLVYMFTHPNDAENLLLMREESFKMLDPRWNGASSSLMFYAFLFLRTLLYPFLILFAWGYYLCTRERRWLIVAISTLLLGGVYAAASIARAPLAAIVMRLMF